MAYLVEFTSRAARDLEHLYEQISAAQSDAASRWFIGLEKAVYRLEQSPRRCPRAPEGRKARRALRHLLYGRKPNVNRIIYQIDESRRTVQILTIRHGAMDQVEDL